MKNLFKFSFLALAITLSVSACNSSQTENNAADSIDSTAEVTSDSLNNLADTVDSAADASIDSISN